MPHRQARRPLSSERTLQQRDLPACVTSRRQGRRRTARRRPSNSARAPAEGPPAQVMRHRPQNSGTVNQRTATLTGQYAGSCGCYAACDVQRNFVHGGRRRLEATVAVSIAPRRRPPFRDGVPGPRAAAGERRERDRGRRARLSVRLRRVLRGFRSLPGQLPLLVSGDYRSMPIRGSVAVRDVPRVGPLVHIWRQPKALVPNHHGVRRCAAVQLRKRCLSAELVLHARGVGRWRPGERCRAHGSVLLDLSGDAS